MENMLQLQLQKEELLKIGFKECTTEADEMNSTITYFSIKTLNGCFYYNPNQPVYTWYHKTIIGEVSNGVNLDINNLPQLYSVLSAFKVNYTLVLI